jgi:hypothetical protein
MFILGPSTNQALETTPRAQTPQRMEKGWEREKEKEKPNHNTSNNSDSDLG